MKRRHVLLTPALAVLALPSPADNGIAPDAPRKVLRVAFNTAETTFDPAQISDLYSRTITPHIFEALYMYDHLARPVKIKPLTAAAMPEVSADWRVWTIKVKPGIFFADDPAFKGQRRELVANDYVYAIKRTADPALKSQLWSWVETFKITGLAEYRSDVLKAKTAFDYDREIEGMRALDRYTIQFKLSEPGPRFLLSIATSDLLGGVAREVVEFYGDRIGEHPVGTGPFRLKQWRRSSLIVLERSPDYREVYYDAEPATAPLGEPAPLSGPIESAHQSRNPVDRLTQGLPHGMRITIDWIVTIAGAIAIVLAIKAWVVNPYRIPSSSMEPTLHCAKPANGCEAPKDDVDNCGTCGKQCRRGQTCQNGRCV